MKFLVLGSCGMAGHMISTYLSEQGHDVLGFDKVSGNHVNIITGDARDTKNLLNIIKEGNFDTVINCIGILNQYAENNKELATFLNAYFPHFLVEATKDTGTQVIHMSTDCVFSGERGKYTENDFPDGKSFYDRSKALGEIYDDKNVTFRTSIVGPDMNPHGIGLLNWFMACEDEINGFANAMWTGLTTLQLAKVMEIGAREKAHGLYNMVYKESISKYDFLKLFNKYLKNDSMTINPTYNFVCDKSLCRTRFEFDCVIPDYEEMVCEMASWMKLHKSMYPHYKL